MVVLNRPSYIGDYISIYKTYIKDAKSFKILTRSFLFNNTN